MKLNKSVLLFQVPSKETLLGLKRHNKTVLNESFLSSSTSIFTSHMGRQDKLIARILRGSSDANISFDELYNLLIDLGFDVRIKGSHHVFRKAGVEELINLQKDGSKAKAYQVKQVRTILTTYNLLGEGDAEV